MLKDYDEFEQNDSEMLDEILNGDEDEQAMISIFDDVMTQFHRSANVSIPVTCAAHSLQLPIVKVLKLPTAKLLISLCRTVAKELRKPNNRYYLHQENIETILPHLDCLTRWGSKYIMVCFLYVLIW